MWDEGKRTRVAGIIDQQRRTVRVSSGINNQERRFTTAHELAHAILHRAMTGMHRARVISGPVPRKDKAEREADAFASSFLMPAKLLLERFQDCYGMHFFSPK